MNYATEEDPHSPTSAAEWPEVAVVAFVKTAWPAGSACWPGPSHR